MAIKQVTTSIIFSGDNALIRIAKAVNECLKSKDCSLKKAVVVQTQEKIELEIVTMDTFTVFKFGQFYERAKI